MARICFVLHKRQIIRKTFLYIRIMRVGDFENTCVYLCAPANPAKTCAFSYGRRRNLGLDWRPFHIWALVCDLCASQRMVKRVGMSLECYHKLIEYNLTDYTYTGILYDPKPKMEAATYVESLYLQ